MEIVFLSAAKAELMDALGYYNMQSEGLGYEFAAEVKRTLERIVQYPDAWFKLSKRTRRCRTKIEGRSSNYQILLDCPLPQEFFAT